MCAPFTVRFVAAALAGLAALLPAEAFAQRTAALTVTAQFNSRTSLQVSSRLLEFDVADPNGGGTAEVSFIAAARTATGSEVMLSVEPARAIAGPGGAADVETSLSFTAHGDSSLSGPVVSDRPTVAARWSGSGRRTGRLVFALQAAAAGRYSVPIRFVLSTP